MKKRLLITFVLVLAALLLASCGRGDGLSLEGKYVVTFYMNDGTLDYKTSNTHTSINFAYHPDVYILDPSTIPGYSLYRAGYNFTGWYTSASCLPNEKWDFDSRTINVERLELYAGWEKAIKHTYTLCYTDENDQIQVLNAYSGVQAGDAFDDWRGLANKRDGYTAIGFYSDPTLQTPWDTSFTHPGGEVDTDVRVYVKYIKGSWTLVSTYDQLNNALKNSKNVYLTNDIDCAANALTFVATNNTYNGIFEGNGYTVSNFTATARTNTLRSRRCSIFNTLGSTAEIRNVNFLDVRYTVETNANVTSIEFAALALSAEEGAKITDVTLSGTLYTNYADDLPRMSEAVYDGTASITIANFAVAIVKESLPQA